MGEKNSASCFLYSHSPQSRDIDCFSFIFTVALPKVQYFNITQQSYIFYVMISKTEQQ
jgi:hypothetical protein